MVYTNWSMFSQIHLCAVGEYWLHQFNLLGRCDSIESLRNRLMTLESEVENPDAFKSLYSFTFGFANVDRHNAKSLSKSLSSFDLLLLIILIFCSPLGTDDAIAYLDLLLRGKFVHLDLWFTFLRVSLLNAAVFCRIKVRLIALPLCCA